jgi:hypothetical protein
MFLPDCNRLVLTGLVGMLLAGCDKPSTTIAAPKDDLSSASLAMGATSLKLGMAKTLLLPDLQSQFRVNVSSDGNEWLIYTKTRSSKFGQPQLGGIDFDKDGTLVEAWAWRTSVTGDTTNGDIGKTIFDLAAQNVRETIGPNKQVFDRPHVKGGVKPGQCGRVKVGQSIVGGCCGISG